MGGKGGWLMDSIYASWDAIEPDSGHASFRDSWREQILPLLRAIANEPTLPLQRRRIKELLLDEAERGTISGQIINLPKDQAAAVLLDYPSEMEAGRDLEWKRNYVGLEMGYYLLTKCTLDELARWGLWIDVTDFEKLTDGYLEAYKYMLQHRLTIVAWPRAAPTPIRIRPIPRQRPSGGCSPR